MGKLIRIESDIDNLISLLAEHSLYNLGDKLNFGIIRREDSNYFIDIKSNLIQLNEYRDSIICPYCKQPLIYVEGYTRQDGVQVTAHLKHESNNTENKTCIFNNLGNPNHLHDKKKFYEDSNFIKERIFLKLPKTPFDLTVPVDYAICKYPLVIRYGYSNITVLGHVKDYILDGITIDILFKTSDGYIGCLYKESPDKLEVCKKNGLRLVKLFEEIPKNDAVNTLGNLFELGTLKYRITLNEVTNKAHVDYFKALDNVSAGRLVSDLEFNIAKELKKDYKMSRVKKSKGYDWVTKNGKICELYWVNIKLGNTYINRKLPSVVVKRMKEKGYDVQSGYRKC